MLVSGRVRSGPGARIAAILLAVAGLLMLPGCWVQSVHGLSEAVRFGGDDQDQAYDPALLGTWVTTDHDCTTTLNVTADAKEYHWKVTNAGKGCGKDEGDTETDYYEGELFKLDDHSFLDLTARADDVCKACVPVHWIFKVELDNDSLSTIPIDSDWLEKAEKDRTVTLAASRGDPYTLMASPKELKEFCRRYADDEEVFQPDPDFAFEKEQP